MLSGFALKIIAILSMTIDHTGCILFPDNLTLRVIGRIAFPIYCYLIAEGFSKTRSVPKYLLRLGAFALISEIPFDLAFHGEAFYWQKCNVFVTLFLGLLSLFLFEKIRSLKDMPAPAGFVLGTVPVILLAVAADLAGTDYGAYGVLMIFLFYIFREKTGLVIFSLFLLTEIKYGIRSIDASAYSKAYSFFKIATIGDKTWYISRAVQQFCIFAAIPIGLYSGEKGYGGAKWLFYVFYPSHLLILYAVKLCLGI